MSPYPPIKIFGRTYEWKEILAAPGWYGWHGCVIGDEDEKLFMLNRIAQLEQQIAQESKG